MAHVETFLRELPVPRSPTVIMNVLLAGLLLAGLCAVDASYYGYGLDGYGGYGPGLYEGYGGYGGLYGGYGGYGGLYGGYGGYGGLYGGYGGYGGLYGGYGGYGVSRAAGVAAAGAQAQSSASATRRSKTEREGGVKTVVRIYGSKERTCSSSRCQKQVRLYRVFGTQLSNTCSVACGFGYH